MTTRMDLVARRSALLAWLREQAHDGLTARQIAARSGVYDYGHGRQERATSDLRALRRAGLVESDDGRSPRWRPL